MLSFALVFLAPAGCVVLVLFPELVDGRFRTYKAFYHDIHAGMTRDQVLAAMERRYPAGGKRKRPTIMSNTSTNLSFFMNPETSREPNCEGIFLMLDGGRVTNVVYSPD
jgi:hypothetical protein